MQAARGTLSREHAFDLAGRWLLQKLRTEIEAWQAVDFPRAVQKAEEGRLALKEWRGDALIVVLRDLIRPLCGAFVGTYRLNWPKLLASVRKRLEEVLAGTFLEEPVSFRSGRFTPVSCLEAIRPRDGVFHNHGLDPEAFALLTMAPPVSSR